MSEENKTTAMQQYGGWDLEDVEKDDALMNEGTSIFLKIKANTRTRIRVLPPLPGTKPYRVVHTHFIRTTDELKRFTCLRMEARAPCPICERGDKLHRSANPKDQDAAKELLPKKRVFWNVIDRGAPEKGPQVWECGKQVWDQLAKIRKGDEDGTGGDFTDPVSGFDLVIERVGSSKNDTEYTVLASRKQTKLENLEWIGEQVNLEGMVRLKSYEDIQKELGLKPAGTEEEDEFAPVGGNKRAGKPASAAKPKPAQPAARSVEDDMSDAEIDENAPT